MSENEVMETISKNAPVSITYGDPGDSRIEISLDLCKVEFNNFHYLISYKDGRFVDIIFGSLTDW